MRNTQRASEEIPRAATLTVFHSVASIRAEHGGPSRSVPALCKALTDKGVEAQLLSAETVGHGGLRATIRQALQSGRADLVHDHGMWLPCNHAVAAMAKRSRLPRVVSPRGMLSEWALSYRRWKKQLAWLLYQHRDLLRVTMFHATSQEELEDIRRLGLRQPVALIPNGVEVPDTAFSVRSPRRRRRALFLSRLHPKKGLANLITAWAQVQPEGWELAIAGPDEVGHRAEVERAVERLTLNGVTFLGAVDDEAKWGVYRTADLFVLPTFSENFGLVVAEALAVGVPVITTRGAPWQELDAYRCGWWIDIGVEPLASALREAVAMDDVERQRMGRRGRRLVESKYTWSPVAEQMLEAYTWLLGRGPKPSCVVET